nr:MAG TPA: hypothetical protein [Caudoviricetes sp.]
MWRSALSLYPCYSIPSGRLSTPFLNFFQTFFGKTSKPLKFQ